MFLDMDAELQNLINVSMNKMTSGSIDICGDRGGRKSRGMDLRKALLVAHVLQEVRCAYLEDDYEIVANTVSEMRFAECIKKQKIEQEFKKNNEKDLYYHLPESDHQQPLPEPTSPTVLQSCVTNANVMVSRISQITRPLAVSVNTNHVMSYLNSPKGGSWDDVPVMYQELDVSSCCEVVSTTVEEDRDQSSDEDDEIIVDCEPEELLRSKKAAAEIDVTCAAEAPLKKTCDVTKISTISTACPLPKKKRPLPKEFLDDDSDINVSELYSIATPVIKYPRIEPSTSMTSYSSCSTSNTVTRTSTSLSVGTFPVFSGSLQDSNAKVVVQMTQSRDNFLTPIACTQLHFSVKPSLFAIAVSPCS